MNKKYALYCSGAATRVIKFYQTHLFEEFPLSFIYYDGLNPNVSQKLQALVGDDLYEFNNVLGLKGAKLSAFISNDILNLSNKFNIDYIFCFGDKILKPPLVTILKNRIVNFHPSLLPAFPGLKAIDQALSTSVQVLGNTAHFIDEGIDTGPIIMQSLISRSSYKSYDDVLDLQVVMLERIWRLLDSNQILIHDNHVEILDSIQLDKYYSIND